MNTWDAFNTCYDRIEPTDSDLRRASERFELTETTLKRAFNALSSTPLTGVHRIGSVERDTAIRPVQDVDLLAVFRNKDNIFEQYRNDAQAFLSRIRRQFLNASRVQKVGARGQAVRLFYADNLWVDIAPAFERRSGGFLLPAGDGTWLESNPLKQNDWVRGRLKTTDHTQQRTVRYAKLWNDTHSRRLGSWHIEVMVLSILQTKSKDRRKCLETFFLLGEHNLDVRDPDDLQGDMSRGMTRQQKSAAEQSFDRAHETASRARQAERNHDHAESNRLWHQILGDDFPLG